MGRKEQHGERLKSRIIHLYVEKTATRRKVEIKNNSPLWGGKSNTAKG